MRPLPNLRQLRYLVMLADHLHFGRAAEACAVTQSTLSAGIHELEMLLGTPVAERTKRSVILTSAGERLAARARVLLREAQDMMEEAAGVSESMAGQINLGVIATINPFVLPRLVPHIRQHFPSLRLNLREDRTLALLDQLADGRLDLVLMAFPFETEGCETFMLFEDAYRFACCQSHPLATAPCIGIDAIAGETLMFLDREQCLHGDALPDLENAGQKTLTSFSATSLHTLVAMVDKGLGTTLLPELAIANGILRGTCVVARPICGRSNTRHVGLAWRRHSARAGSFLRLAEFIKSWSPIA